MAATGSEAIMGELIKEGWEWIKSERYHKKEADKAKKREANNPMKTCVLKSSLVIWETISSQHSALLHDKKYSSCLYQVF